MAEEEQKEAWQMVGNSSKKEKTKKTTAEPSKATVKILTNNFKNLEVIEEADEEVEETETQEDIEEPKKKI